MNDKLFKIVLMVLVLVVGALGYWVGDSKGYSRSQAEVKKAQEIAAQRAADNAAKAANPFKATNPLEGVEANPFKEAKKVLNPFD